MGQASNVERLPREVRERIDELLRQKVTLDDIMAKLGELGVAGVSRSGLGRYKQRVEQYGEELRQRLEVANSLIEKLGEAPEGKMGRFLVEALRGLVFDLMAASGAAEDEGGIDDKTIARLARSLRDLAAAQKTDAEVVLRLRKELAAEAQEKLKQLERGGAKQGGPVYDPEMLKRVREELYGITV